MAAVSNRIEYAADQPPSFLARWASRLALFCCVLLVVALFLHRVLNLPTPIAMNLSATAFAGAIVSAAMAAIAALDIWVTGRQGAARVVIAFALSGALLSVPAMIWLASGAFPMIADVTTDIDDPPQFEVAANVRPEGANKLDYDAAVSAQLQTAGYPDLRTLVVPRTPEDTFEAVLQALTKLKMKPAAQVPPDEAADGNGTIELSDRTLILGFRDDVVIRVRGDETASSVDIRSSSRYGRNDFGRNATRVRMILKEIVGRLEATVPAQRTKPVAEDAQSKKKAFKRPAAGSRPTAGNRPKSNPSRPASRYAPEPSAAPPE